MATRDTTKIKKRRYRILQRTAASFTKPTSAAEYTTLLGTFTEMGYARNKSIKMTIEKGDEEVLDDGTKLLQGYNGKLEGEILQSDEAMYTELTGIENTNIDLLITDEVTNKAVFFPTVRLFFLESITSGETEIIPFVYEKENFSVKSDFRTHFDIPTS